MIISKDAALALLLPIARSGGEYAHSGNCIMIRTDPKTTGRKWRQLCQVETLQDAKAVTQNAKVKR